METILNLVEQLRTMAEQTGSPELRDRTIEVCRAVINSLENPGASGAPTRDGTQADGPSPSGPDPVGDFLDAVLGKFVGHLPPGAAACPTLKIPFVAIPEVR